MKKRDRVYARERGGVIRWYGDFRDLGGTREALVVPGEKLATSSKELADTLAAKRVLELQRKRAESQGRTVAGLPPITPLKHWVREHLIAKKMAGKVTEDWLEGMEMRLGRAITYFGADRDLSDIKVADVRRWNEALTAKGLSGSTRRQHVYSLSHLYRYAQSEGKVAEGYNPVAALMDKPVANKGESPWMEVHAAALLLEAARTYTPKREDVAMPFAYELIATALLTGGRPDEVFGLEVDDISLERDTVTFRPHDTRRLKNVGSARVVPLWPQLKEILRAYFPRREAMGGGKLLFPSFRTGEEAMLTDVRKMLDNVGERVGYKARKTGVEPDLNMYMFRHTYCAARLQTLDNGAPVSPFTVGRELGHGGDALVRRIYGHLGTVRHRAEAVEYRVKQHGKVKHRDKPVAEWVKALRALKAA